MILHLHFYLFLLLGLGTHACKSTAHSEKSEKEEPSFKQLLVDIRERNISPRNAKIEFQYILSGLKNKYQPKAYDSLNVDLVFPLRTKNYRSVGGKGKGFYGRHFNLFDHSVAKSHPAHDIFIYDLNRDCIEDNDKDYVDILAVSDGVIIATERNWTEDTDYKGGNYVWLYDFETGGLWYYAHQREVYVEEGQMVQKGDRLGQVGRTGFNAETNRSDTHLHLMYLKIDEQNNPTPINHYPWLKKAKTVYKVQLPVPMPPKPKITTSLLLPLKPRLLNTIYSN